MKIETSEEQIKKSASSSILADDKDFLSTQSWSSRVVAVASTLVFAVSIVVLLVWLFDISFLKKMGAASMLPNTAFGLAVSAIALWCLRNHHRGNWQRRLAQTGGAIVMLLGLLVMGQCLFGWPGAGSLLFSNNFIPQSPVRPSFLTAANFILCGAALIFLGMRSAKPRYVDLLVVVADRKSV